MDRVTKWEKTHITDQPLSLDYKKLVILFKKYTLFHDEGLNSQLFLANQETYLPLNSPMRLEYKAQCLVQSL